MSREGLTAIEHLSDRELEVFEKNYRKANLTEGGPYTLFEVLLEKRRRSPNPFGAREMTVKIVELASASDDGLTTYGDLWSAFRPGVPWIGNNPRSVVSKALDRVIYFCVKNHLPIVTVLVVQKGVRKLSKQAVNNIYNECKDLGVDVGLDAEAFVFQQINLSHQLLAADIPEES